VDDGDYRLADCVDAAAAARQQQTCCAPAEISLGDDRGITAAHDELRFMESPTQEPAPTKPVTLDYGRAESMSSSWYRRFWAGVQERVDGVFHFVGLLIYFVGGPRQAGFAFGLASLAGGLGLCLQRDVANDGPYWMWVGGFLVGLVLPLPAKRKAD
jgi:hypothetical protein